MAQKPVSVPTCDCDAHSNVILCKCKIYLTSPERCWVGVHGSWRVITQKLDSGEMARPLYCSYIHLFKSCAEILNMWLFRHIKQWLVFVSRVAPPVKPEKNTASCRNALYSSVQHSAPSKPIICTAPATATRTICFDFLKAWNDEMLRE